MRYLGHRQMSEIIDLNGMMDCVEQAFDVYDSGAFHMPDRLHADRPEGTVLYMPCFAGEVSGTKIVSTFPDNIQSGIPSVQGTMVLNNSRTGEPLAIMDGAAVTAYRTGAVGGVGVRHTTRENCRRLGLVGTGVQGFFQVLFACAARPIEVVYIHDRSKERMMRFKEALEDRLRGVAVHAVGDAVELVRESEIIVTATPAKHPVLPDDPALLKGKHIIAIGSYKYDMRELPPALYQVLDEVYMDTELAAEESGDLIVPVEQGWMKREDYTCFARAFRTLPGAPGTAVRTTLYKSVGMALFDLLVAEQIYRNAVAKNIGIELGE